MERRFEAIAEDLPGPKWQALSARYWPAYRRWFLSEGVRARPTYLSSLRALRQYLPELVPTYEAIVELAGGSDTAACFLSLYCPPAYLTACSQAVWPGGAGESLLVRNYDYSPMLFEGVILKSAWNGKHVIASSDCLWGVLDGINEDGLAVSLTFGGRRIVGKGFGVPLLLRYILEFCTDTTEALEVLRTVPSHMAYNVTVLDKSGIFRTAYIAPDRETIISQALVTTNHQKEIEWQQHADATATLERERFLTFRLRESDTAEKLIQAFLRSPVYSTAYNRGFGTLYTAVYTAANKQAEYRWPNGRWQQSLTSFEEGVRIIRFPDNP